MQFEQLYKEFPEIKNAFFKKENQNIFLRIEVNLKNLEAIAEISKKISSWLDNQEIEHDNYFLDIYSSGVDKIIKIDEVEQYLDQHVKLKLKKGNFDKEEITGYILQLKPFIFKWNNKGKIRRDEFDIKDIKEIKLDVRVGK